MADAPSGLARKRSYQDALAIDETSNDAPTTTAQTRGEEALDALLARKEAHRAELASRMEVDKHIDQEVLLEQAEAETDAEAMTSEMILAAEAFERQMEESAIMEAQIERYAAQLLKEAAIDRSRGP